jgi:hypothetical protein
MQHGLLGTYRSPPGTRHVIATEAATASYTIAAAVAESRRHQRQALKGVLMDWKQIADRANQLVIQRGGPQSVKEDAYELKDIIQGQGTTQEKLKRAMDALRDPGANRQQAAASQPAGPGEGQSTPAQDGGEGSGENTN